jgi:hypothetical protein
VIREFSAYFVPSDPFWSIHKGSGSQANRSHPFYLHGDSGPIPANSSPFEIR